MLREIEALREMEIQVKRESGPADDRNQGRIEDKQTKI